MSYLPSLEKLRKEADEEPVHKPRTPALINPRAAPVVDDPTTMSKEWVAKIRERSKMFREANKTKIEEASAPPPRSVVQNTAPTTPAIPEDPKVGPNGHRSIFSGMEGDDGEYRGYPDTSYSGNTSGLMGLMDRYEGGGRYDTLFGHSQKNRFKGIDVSKMTLGQLKDFQSTKGEYGNWVKQELGRQGQTPRIATPIGRYQFVGTTLRNVSAAMGLSDDTVFDKGTQDAMFQFHLRRTLASAKGGMMGKVKALRGQWEGFKNVPTPTLVAEIRKLEDANA